MRVGSGVRILGYGSIVVEQGATLELGDGCCIMQGADVIVTRDGTLALGRDVYIGSYCNLRCAGEIWIADRVRIAQGVSIVDANYHFRQRTAPSGSVVPAAVRVEAGAYIGAHALLLPDVTIGEGAIVEAGSVVTEDVPPFSIVAGNPAAILGYRG